MEGKVVIGKVTCLLEHIFYLSGYRKSSDVRWASGGGRPICSLSTSLPYNLLLKEQNSFSAQRCRKLVITERLERTIPADNTVVENQRKTLILHCERSELRLHFEWTKISGK